MLDTAYTVRRTMYVLQCMTYAVQHILFTAYCVRRTLYSIQYTSYTIHRILYAVQLPLHNDKRTKRLLPDVS